MKRFCLDGQWELAHADPGEGEKAGWPQKGCGGPNKIAAPVPGQVHQALLAAGLLPEPLYGRNAAECRWIEDKDWWYSRTFTVPGEMVGHAAELYFAGLDTAADIWLNGQHVGSQKNMFVPYTVDVTNALRSGENLLVVRVDCGRRWALDKEMDRYKGMLTSTDPDPDVRIWVRRPQFTFGWDWAPRLLTAGIWRSVELRFYRAFALRSVFLHPKLEGDRAKVRVQMEVENLANWPQEAFFTLHLSGPGGCIKPLEATLTPGYNLLSTELTVERPRLWWPRPLGEPFLYNFALKVCTAEGEQVDEYCCQFGIREVDLIQEPCGDEGQTFIIAVNGRPVFCKGADWVPADSLIARVEQEKYERLIELAIEANFNMFRIWGGGIYEDEYFYQLCDRYGIMVWQDFLFACSYIPDDDPAFCAEVEREVNLALRQLRNHPSIVFWCGNNENAWLHYMRNPEGVFYGRKIYHELLPRLCASLDPSRPYWPSSPYGGIDPNDESLGNRHSWYITILGEEDRQTEYKRHAQDRGKFISEFGFLAPPPRASLEKFLPPEEMRPDSPSWQFHNNTFERGVIALALKTHFGLIAAELPLDDYLLRAQLFQAEALKYALTHYRRRKFRCAGSLFWMYSDCWGASAGWTIVDYYLNLKPSYYYVRRAFAPLLLSFQEEQEGLSLWFVNDTTEDVGGLVEYGTASFQDTTLHPEGCREVIVQANSARCLEGLILPQIEGEEAAQRFCYARFLVEGQSVSEDRYFFAPFGKLKLDKAQLTYWLEPGTSESHVLKVLADKFAWAVKIQSLEEVKLEDNYFDLFPGVEKAVPVKGPESALQAIRLRAFNSDIASRK